MFNGYNEPLIDTQPERRGGVSGVDLLIAFGQNANLRGKLWYIGPQITLISIACVPSFTRNSNVRENTSRNDAMTHSG